MQLAPEFLLVRNAQSIFLNQKINNKRKEKEEKEA